jgi:hypothetical protein
MSSVSGKNSGEVLCTECEGMARRSQKFSWMARALVWKIRASLSLHVTTDLHDEYGHRELES